MRITKQEKQQLCCLVNPLFNCGWCERVLCTDCIRSLATEDIVTLLLEGNCDKCREKFFSG